MQNDITEADFSDDVSENEVPDNQQKVEDSKVTPSDKTEDEERLDLNEAQIALLLDLAERAETEDKQVRESLLRIAKGHHDYFRGFQDAFWSEVAHDWTLPTDDELDEIGDSSEALGRIVNIVRAHGEALISALGSNPPGSKYLPDDAESEADVTSAKAHTKLEKLFNKHNDGPLLFYKTLFYLYLEGIVFGHNYNDTDESYGKAKVKTSKPALQTGQNLACPECGFQTQEVNEPVLKGGESNNEQPNTENSDGASQVPQELPEQQIPNQEGIAKSCPQCGALGKQTEMQGDAFEEEIEIEVEEEVDKTRECLDIYSTLNIKFPLYARKQSDGGYLRLAFEEDTALTKDRFPEIFDDIEGVGGLSAAQTYERWARTDSQYLGQVPPELTTVRVYWFRNWFFNKLGNPADNEDLAFLKDKYKNGCKITLLNQNTVAEVTAENLDEHWTISVDPLCNSLHADPICKPIISIQDVTNDVYNLEVETISHGIAETFVDSDVLDFQKYQSQRAQPGMKYPVKAKAGKSIAESFYQDKSATLSEELGRFDESLETKGQFVLGSFPSIYGGNQSGGSKTLGEYQQSRAQALQRLGIVWKKVTFFFTNIHKKAIPALAKAIKDNKYDERYVEETGTSFINIWIRHTELSGKIGEVTCEASDNLPVTWAQRRELLFQLIQLQNPVIESVFSNPQNAPVIRDALGLDDIYIPGEDDRDKQFAEFVILLEGTAEGPNPETGLMEPSVPVNPWDDHQVEFSTCRSFLVSSTGLAFKDLKPEGFQNIVAHMNQHQMALQNQVQANLPGSQPGQKPESNAGSGVE
jgi:hypothetical protein